MILFFFLNESHIFQMGTIIHTYPIVEELLKIILILYYKKYYNHNLHISSYR